MFKRAERLKDVQGFGIDRTAVAADARTAARDDWPVLRMENLDTDLPLPPEAIPETVRHEVTLASIDDATTELTVHEFGYPSPEIAGVSRAGMEECLDKMATLVATA